MIEWKGVYSVLVPLAFLLMGIGWDYYSCERGGVIKPGPGGFLKNDAWLVFAPASIPNVLRLLMIPEARWYGRTLRLGTSLASSFRENVYPLPVLGCMRSAKMRSTFPFFFKFFFNKNRIIPVRPGSHTLMARYKKLKIVHIGQKKEGGRKGWEKPCLGAITVQSGYLKRNKDEATFFYRL